MKRNVIVPFLLSSIIALILVLLLIHRLELSLAAYGDDNQKDQYLVNANDIRANIQELLVRNESSGLSAALRQYGYGLEIYDIQGRLLYNSENSITQENRYDMNNILAGLDNSSKLMFVNIENRVDGLPVVAVIHTGQKKFSLDEINKAISRLVWSIFFIFTLIAALIFLFLFYRILRPFNKLQQFTGEIAKGNLEAALPQDRRNLFGAFTWAFDMLRSELKASRERETEIENTKKELVAALSHDVRTPIASIKAYAECLKSLPDKSTERGERYIDVIIKKTDELAKLSADMFMHAIMDLEKLEVKPQAYSSRELLNSILESLILEYGDKITVTSAIPDVTVLFDKQRLVQVCENIISNSVKYSPDKDIHITSCISDGFLKCRFKDFGQGVSPEDLPFIFDKFFRGKNAKESGQSGSGLGLYTSRYIIERCGGDIKASNWHENAEHGFLIEISLKIV